MRNEKAYSELLSAVYDEFHGGDAGPGQSDTYALMRDAFVFHMTDMLEDIQNLAALEKDPGSTSVDQATSFLVAMLYHVPAHLRAARLLLLGEVTDPFADDPLLALAAQPETTSPRH